MNTFLITGATGLLGHAIANRLKPMGETLRAGLRPSAISDVCLDLRDPEELRKMLLKEKPDVVVHCAAYRDPDVCEEHPDETARLNVAPVRVMAGALSSEARLIYISTDYVFDGRNPPYGEDDVRSPLQTYGKTKAAGEVMAMEHPNALILRVPLLIGRAPRGEIGFAGQLLQLARAEQPTVVDDVLMRCPTWVEDVAEAVAWCIESDQSGVLHYAAERVMTRYAWAVEACALLGVSADHLAPSRTVVPRKAERPVDATLSTGRIRALGFNRFTDFADAFASCIPA